MTGVDPTLDPAKTVGGDAADAGRRRQPPDDRSDFEVLTQHRDAGAAAGRGGAMTTDVAQRRYLTAYRRDCC